MPKRYPSEFRLRVLELLAAGRSVALHNDETPRPCGPPEAGQPAFLGALADLARSLESL